MKVFAKFLTAAAEPTRFPTPGPPEIAFLGRSNVGKSSLINSLLGEKMAKTSSTPGRTRTINFFEIRRQGHPQPELLFVDLPGYGYAKLPPAMTAEWPKFIEPYLEKREPLALCIALVDVNIAPQEKDRHLIEYLRHVGRRFLIVGTKSDRLSGSRLQHSLDALKKTHHVKGIVPFSARTGEGREHLWREIRSACGMGPS